MGKNGRYILIFAVIIGLIWVTFNVRIEGRTPYGHFRKIGGEGAILRALKAAASSVADTTSKAWRWVRKVGWKIFSTVGTWFDNIKRAARAGWRAWVNSERTNPHNERRKKQRQREERIRDGSRGDRYREPRKYRVPPRFEHDRRAQKLDGDCGRSPCPRVTRSLKQQRKRTQRRRVAALEKAEEELRQRRNTPRRARTQVDPQIRPEERQALDRRLSRSR